MDEKKRIDLAARYQAAMHAMQSGVAKMLELHNAESGGTNLGACSPKHLRVGVNSALTETGMLARILIKKGIVTEEEYAEALTEAAELEVKSYEEQLSKLLGTKVTLA